LHRSQPDLDRILALAATADEEASRGGPGHGEKKYNLSHVSVYGNAARGVNQKFSSSSLSS
jgi:hypothetical protein